MTQMIKRVLILMAMQSEADPLIKALSLLAMDIALDDELPFKVYVRNTPQQELALVVSGKDARYDVDNIGPQAATLMAYTAIKKFEPDLVISIGTAGGFSLKGAEIGTVYLSDQKFIFHDRIVPLPGFDHSAVGHYPAHNIRRMAADLYLPYGIVSSGSSLKKSAHEVDHLFAGGAVAKEMEAAAVAWVCWLKKKPLIAIKAITNLLDREGESEQLFLENFTYACQRLEPVVANVLSYLRNKSLADLSEIYSDDRADAT